MATPACCDLHAAGHPADWPCLTIIARARIPAPPVETHEQLAARLYAGNFISAGCAKTPCEPCDGHVVRDGQEQLCVCSHHNLA